MGDKPYWGPEEEKKLERGIAAFKKTGVKAEEKSDAVSAKIAKLIREGKDPEQAAAVAYSMWRAGKI